ncbi:uncharacterized protein LOC123885502 [Trifolium pratense]|uniref:Uncharacterized protein n=1 Tax=Trifolium pratense TaxID=57577 RepID=A0ACB0L597_TRIPR|nr:uncharacterized protein LOC123885502 [Trifolium pratense]CAJ2664296.1 unnamed protein product [Trifolium pratense]
MKKKLHHDKDLEVLKAVAQAWYNHSGSVKPLSEFDARRRNFKGNPTRFKLETLTKKSSSTSDTNTSSSNYYSDFQQSLWDPYELVAVSRRIETGLALDNPFDDFCVSTSKQLKGKRESKNSLRNLFNNMSSRRFNVPKFTMKNDTI